MVAVGGRGRRCGWAEGQAESGWIQSHQRNGHGTIGTGLRAARIIVIGMVGGGGGGGIS